MFIRIQPGEAYSYTVDKFPDRKYQQLLPVPLERWQILDLRANMTPEQWYVYSVLVWYEQIKFEVKTPALEEMRMAHLPKMTREDFERVINELREIYCETKEGLIRLVNWQRGEVEQNGLCDGK